MARIRSIPKAVKEIKAEDPGTSISVSTLRRWVKEGKIPHVKNGAHFMVDVDVVNEIMSGS